MRANRVSRVRGVVCDVLLPHGTVESVSIRVRFRAGSAQLLVPDLFNIRQSSFHSSNPLLSLCCHDDSAAHDSA